MLDEVRDNRKVTGVDLPAQFDPAGAIARGEANEPTARAEAFL